MSEDYGWWIKLFYWRGRGGVIQLCAQLTAMWDRGERLSLPLTHTHTLSTSSLHAAILDRTSLANSLLEELLQQAAQAGSGGAHHAGHACK